ncbi:MAG: DMT family transporter [Luteimonas sp.]|nr:DMT family transporter [Luteimonas sp.]
MNLLKTWAVLGATGVAMGLAMPLGKLAVNHGVAPLTFVMVPALISGVLLAGLAWWRHGPPADLHEFWRFGLVAGLLGNAVPNTLTAWLSGDAGASFSAIAFTLPPVFTLGLMLVLGWERASVTRGAAVTLGLAGALWLAASRLTGGDLSVAGAVALFVIPASLGAGNVYRARWLPVGLPAEWLGAAMSLGAFTLLLPVWIWSPGAYASFDAAGWPFLAAQVAASTVGAVLFFHLQRRAEPVLMSFLGYAMALTAVLAGAFLLGERLTWQLLPAGLLIMAGFWLLQRPAAQFPSTVATPQA